MRFFGAAPINPYALVMGKLCAVACWASLVARFFWRGLVWFRSPWLDALGAVLLAVGLLLALAGLVNLGGSLRVGLPTGKTALKTSGVYRYTRNPIYVGGLLMCLAAVAWTMHPMILALCLVAAIVHHRIVLAEEKFLAAEFGDAWTQYSAKVRRYL
jgi:protein-S-isoprenylcysteine O-methyltransferase Ste14